MKRRAWGLLVFNALLMVGLAVVCSVALGVPLRDPDGFLGPSWLRLPLLVGGAFLLDVIPRTLWRSRLRPSQIRRQGELVIREHWTWDRIKLVVIGLLSFYAVYVSYRNLKGMLPFIRSEGGKPLKYDHTLHRFDQWLLFGHDPAVLLHDVLGTGPSAYVLSWVYLAFLPMVPVVVIAWVVWSRNVSFGYWFVTADCLAWTIGTLTYYLVPTLGPNFAFAYLYEGLPDVGATQLVTSLYDGRYASRFSPLYEGVQSVAGFASLHVGITLTVALVAQYTVRSKLIRTVLWVYLVLVILSTTYFGWHYIADDVAGAALALVSVYLGALATGQKFDRRGRSSHPTTTTSSVPIEARVDGEGSVKA